MPYRGRIFNVYFEPYGRKDLIERKMLDGNRRTFHIFMTESGKKNQKLVEEAF